MKKKDTLQNHKTTEQDSAYTGLEKMKVRELLQHINKEDIRVPDAVAQCIPAIEKLIKKIVIQMNQGGRLFYIGAGTSGRLGILDASECPPTFGVPQGMVIGIIAGGDSAIRKAVEFAEDDTQQGYNDLKKHKISSKDFVIGIAASGSTPYVIGALAQCREKGITTGCIVCNKNSELAKYADHKVECIVGPEFVTGSTRMKAGTAQKLILNMISTGVMIQMGRIKNNKMVDMQLTNNKLIERGTRMIMDALHLDAKAAAELLHKHGNVRNAISSYNQ